MRSSRRGRRLEDALARAHAAEEAAARVEETGARMDRLVALRTAGLMSEEEFLLRCAALLDAASAEPRQIG